MPKKTTEREIKELIRELTNSKSPLPLKGVDYLADPLLAGIIKCFQSPHDFFNSLHTTRRKTSSQMARQKARVEDDGDENKQYDTVTNPESSIVTRSRAASHNITRSPPPRTTTQPPIPLRPSERTLSETEQARGLSQSYSLQPQVEESQHSLTQAPPQVNTIPRVIESQKQTQSIHPQTQMSQHDPPPLENPCYQATVYDQSQYYQQRMPPDPYQNQRGTGNQRQMSNGSRVEMPQRHWQSSGPPPLPQHGSIPNPYVQQFGPVYPVANETWATYMNNIVEFSDGRGREAMRFLRSFDEVVGMFATAAEATKVYWFGTKLTGLARVWFDSIKNDVGVNLTWHVLRDRFIWMYGKGRRKEIDILVDIKGTKQNAVSGESVRHFVIRLGELFSEYSIQTGMPLTEDEKCRYFLGGLMARLRPFLVSHYQTLRAARMFPTLNSMIKEAYKLEATIRQTDEELEEATERLRFDSDDGDDEDLVRSINAVLETTEPSSSSSKVTNKTVTEKPKDDSKYSKDTTRTKGLPNLIETLRQSKEKQETFNRTMENKLDNLLEDSKIKYETLQKAILNFKDHVRQLMVQKELNKVTPEKEDNRLSGYNQSGYGNNYYNRQGYNQSHPRSSEEVRTPRTQDGRIFTCNFCKEPGHFKRECSKFQKWLTVKETVGKIKNHGLYPSGTMGQRSKDWENTNNNNSNLHQPEPKEISGKVQNVAVRFDERIQTISEHIGEDHSSDTEECLDDITSVEALDSIYEFLTEWAGIEDIEDRQKSVNSIRNMNYSGVKRFARDLLTARGTVARVPVEAIFDSGAVTTCMSFDYFKKLPYEVKIKLDKSVKLPRLTAATGQAMNLVGELKTDLQFEDEQGKPVVFREVPFVVTKDLTNSILVGSNLLGSHRFTGFTVDFTKRTLSFRHRVGDDSTTILMIRSEFEDTRADGKCPVQLLRDVTIPSSSMMYVPEKTLVLNRSVKSTIQTDTKEKESTMLFEADNNQFKMGVQIRPALVKTTVEEPTVPILLINETDHPYLVRAGTVIGSCEIVSNKVAEWGFQRNHVYSVMDEHSTIRKGPTMNSNSVGQLEGLKAGSISPEVMEELKRLLTRFKILFEDRPYGSNAVGLTEHSIELIDPKCKPVKQYAYKVSPALGKKQKDFVEDMMKKGVIKVSEGSPWASPVVCVPKSDGTLRFCTDFRRLNALTEADVFPIPRQDDVTDRMLGCKWFSKLDLKDAFHQVPVKEDDQPKTAFICQGQLYEYLKMPFGLKNSPACFQRNIQNVIGDCEYAMPYLDDIIVHSRTDREHIGHLASVLEKMSRYRLHCKLSKCEFFQSKVKYLGLIFSQEGITVDQEKVSGIVRMLPPTNLTELRSFLGMCNFYRKFIKDFSSIAVPMTRLTHKDTKWDFDESCDRAFKLLKTSLVSAPILACPNFEKKFILTTDASNWAVGAVLSQEDDNDVERPICFLSRKLNEHELNYATTHKECLAVVWSIDELRHYLQGHKFLIRTDHLALKYLMTTKDLQGRLARWALKIMEYDFDIDYIKGKDNKVADALSRVPINQIQEQHMIPENTLEERLKEIKKLQEEDQTLRQLMLYLITGEIPEELTNSSNFIMESKNYVMDNGILFHLHHQMNVRKKQVIKQLVIPISLRAEILYSFHDCPFAGHFGTKRTYERLYERYYWNGMWRDTDDWVKSCPTCQMKKHPRHGEAGHPVSETHIILSNEPMCDISVDLVGPLPETEKGNKYICVFIDRYSRYPECFAIPDKEAKTIANLFVKEIVCRYGCPKTILSDRGKEFLNLIAEEVYKMCNVRKLNTSGYRPQTNGLNERSHPTLMNSLSAYVNAKNKDWDDYLPYACFAFRTSKNEFTKETPFYLLFGRTAKFPVDRVFSFEEEYNSSENCILEMARKMREARVIYESYVTEALDEKKRFNEAIERKRSFDVGDLVLVYKRRIPKGTSSKFAHCWHGPYMVITKYDNQINYLLQYTKRGKKEIAHIGNMKKYFPPSQTRLAEIERQVELEGSKAPTSFEEFEVDAVLDDDEVEGEIRFLIRWKGYEDKDNSWEPIENLSNAKQKIQKYLEKKNSRD